MVLLDLHQLQLGLFVLQFGGSDGAHGVALIAQGPLQSQADGDFSAQVGIGTCLQEKGGEQGPLRSKPVVSRGRHLMASDLQLRVLLRLCIQLICIEGFERGDERGLVGIEAEGLVRRQVEELPQEQQFLLILVEGLGLLVKDTGHLSFEFGEGGIGQGAGVHEILGMIALGYHVRTALLCQQEKFLCQQGLQELLGDAFPELASQPFVLGDAFVPKCLGGLELVDPASAFKEVEVALDFPLPLPVEGVGALGVGAGTAGQSR